MLPRGISSIDRSLLRTARRSLASSPPRGREPGRPRRRTHLPSPVRAVFKLRAEGRRLSESTVPTGARAPGASTPKSPVANPGRGGGRREQTARRLGHSLLACSSSAVADSPFFKAVCFFPHRLRVKTLGSPSRRPSKAALAGGIERRDQKNTDFHYSMRWITRLVRR